MNQIDIDYTPASRNTDPRTSMDSERSTNRVDGTHRAVELVRMWPNLTSGEIVQRCVDQYGWKVCKANTIGKRISDAERVGLVRSSGVRKCTESGRPARTWVVA